MKLEDAKLSMKVYDKDFSHQKGVVVFLGIGRPNPEEGFEDMTEEEAMITVKFDDEGGADEVHTYDYHARNIKYLREVSE